MKKLKRIFSLMIAVVMVLAMGMTVSAEDNYSLTFNTITGDKATHTYTAYQVFTGTYTDGKLINISSNGSDIDIDSLLNTLKAESTSDNLNPFGTDFARVIDAPGIAKVLTENTAYSYDSTKMVAFAEAVENNIKGEGNVSSVNSTTGKQQITGLAAGYYLITDSIVSTDGTSAVHSRYILRVIGGSTNIDITPKTSVPSVEKKVEENDKANNNGDQDLKYGDDFNDVADWSTGDNVTFRLYGTLPSNLDDYDTYNYIFHDTMSKGLTYNKDAKVYLVNNADVEDEEGKVNGTEITSSFNISATGGNEANTSITISCENIKGIDEVTSNSKIVVEYTAKLNEYAVIGRPGNVNGVYLEFSNNPNSGGTEKSTTPSDYVIVFTYELDTTKVDAQDSDEKLGGAEFVLLNANKTKVAVLENGRIKEWEDIPSAADGSISYESWAIDTKLTSSSGESDKGKFEVWGLDDGVYFLREIKAPESYNLPNDPDTKIEIVATTSNGHNWNGSMNGDVVKENYVLTELQNSVNDSALKAGTPSTGIVEAEVTNNQLMDLPETGGIGTRIFYAVGAILMIGAAVVFITKKRTEK